MDRKPAHQERNNDKTQTAENKGKQKEDVNTARSLDKALSLLQASDDTSQFVGLALLKSLLDNHAELRDSKETIVRCWKAVPANFLDRLLKARPSEERPKEEAQHMIGLAVAVIYAFLTLLPRDVAGHDRSKVSLEVITAAEPFSSPETASQISQISLALCLPFWRLRDLPEANQFDDPRSSPYLLIKMLLVDIRSSLSWLQEKLNSSEYPTTSNRLAETYDVISNFIGYLVQSLDEEDTKNGPQPLSFEPSQLLQLRVEISETMSLTIEHLRDRYDASVAGAAGLHPSARVDPDPNSSNPKTITWESTSTSMSQDPLTLSEIRTFALWLREDENDALRREAAGIMDVLLGLYASEEAESNIRSAVLTATEGMFEVPDCIEAFLREDGWDILSKDLRQILFTRRSEDENRGLELVRALLTIAESDVVGPAKQEWVGIADLAIATLQDPFPERDSLQDLRSALCQLAAEVLIKLPKGLRKKNKSKVRQLAQLAMAEANQLNQLASGKRGEAEDTKTLLEVVEGLEGLDA